MEQAEYYKNFRIIVEKIFNNWQDLRLAVEHGMGGHDGQKIAIQVVDYVYEYCVRNDNITQGELQQVLEDLMNEEFNTICDNGSITEICSNLLRYKQMAIKNQYNEIEAELSQISGNNWLREDVKIILNGGDTSSSSESSSSESDTSDMDIDMNNVYTSSTTSFNELNKEQKSKKGHDDFGEPDPGWTIVRNKKR